MKDKARRVGRLVVAMTAVGVLAGWAIAPTPAHADAGGQQITSLGALTINVHGDGLNVTKVATGVFNVPDGLTGMCFDFQIFGQNLDDTHYESPVVTADCGTVGTWADFDINQAFAPNSRLCAAVRKSASDPWEHNYACVWIEP